MNFLKNGYDKIVLGLLLFVLVWQLFAFVQDVSEFNTKVKTKNINKDFVTNESGLKFQPIDAANEFYLDGQIEKSLVDLSTVDPKDKSWTVGEYFNCTNPDCKKLLVFSTELAQVCPHCQATQPVLMDDNGTRDGDDDDEDGMPNTVEDQYAFLSDDDSSDAKRDSDGDYFPNIYEYTSKPQTAMDDATSHPPLVKLLRYKGIRTPKLGLRVGEISADVNDLQNSSFEMRIKGKRSWSTRYDIVVNKRFRIKTGYFKVLEIIKVAAKGEFDVVTYQLKIAKLSVVGEKENVVSEFIVPANSHDIRSKDRVIGFQYLRTPDDYEDGPSAMLKETFILDVKKDGVVVSKETYQVDSIEEGKVHVSLMKDGKVVSKHEVGKFNEEVDKEYLDQREAAEEKLTEKVEKTTTE